MALYRAETGDMRSAEILKVNVPDEVFEKFGWSVTIG